MSNMLDAILLPKTYYKSMSVSKMTLLTSVIVIGMLQFCLPFLAQNYQDYFTGRPVGALVYNAVITCLLTFLLGLVNVFACCRPISDFFRYVSGKLGGYRDQFLLLKTMKIYTLAELIVQPLAFFVSMVVFRYFANANNPAHEELYQAILILLQLWAVGIVSRGVSSVLRYKGVQQLMVFLITATWMYLWTYLFQLMAQGMKVFYMA
jgi:hypothetical protein